MKERPGIKFMLLAAAAALFFSMTSLDCSYAATSYKVKKGDNINKIAKKFNTTPAKIRDANDLDSDKIKVGRKLVIPSDKKTAGSRSKDAGQTVKAQDEKRSGHKISDENSYTVKKGDSIYTIAKKFKTTPAKIKEANDLDSSHLKIGRKLAIPSDKKVKIAETKTKEKKAASGSAEREDSDRRNPDSRTTYKVQKKDSVAKIAKKFNTTPAKIRQANDLGSSGRIKVGQRLVIPSNNKGRVVAVYKDKKEDSSRENSETKTYKVKKSDSVAKIAKKFNTTPAKIRQANDLGSSGRIKVGQRLVIPSSGKTVRKEAPEMRPTPDMDVEIVKAAEEKKSAEHKTDAADMAAKPSDNSAGNVVAGKDANRDNTSLDHKLVIHSAPREDKDGGQEGLSAESRHKEYMAATKFVDLDTRPVYKYHRFKRGETLASVAKKYGISVRELKSINDLKRKKKVRPGQNLIVGTLSTKGSGKTARLQRVDVSRKIEQVRKLSESDSLAEISAVDRLILFAKKMLDIPYKFGANGVMGLDCSSFVQRVYSFVNMKLPRSAREQFEVGQPISKSELKSGDLLFFRTYARFPSHVGIYLGDNLFIHASSLSKKVTIDSINKPYYVNRYIGAKRLLTDTVDNMEDAAAAIVNKVMQKE
jgi:LysM repeat protein